MRQQQVRRQRTGRGEAAAGLEEPPPAQPSRVGLAAARVIETIDAALAGD